MRLAPEVNNFVRSRGYEPREQTWVQKGADVLGKAAMIGGTLVAANALAGGFNPKTAKDLADVAGALTEGTPTPPPPPTRVGEKGFVRIPTERPVQEVERKPKNVRIPVHTKENYGNVTPRRDLIAESEAKAAEIINNQIVKIEKGGQIEDPWIDEANTRVYSPISKAVQGSGLVKTPRNEQRGRLRRIVEDAAENRPVERDILRGGEAATTAAIVKNAADAVNIAKGGEPMGNAVTDLVTKGRGGVKEAIMQKIPPYHALTESVHGGIQNAQNLYEGIRGLGFAPGANVGTVLDWAATQASNLPGAANVSEISGNVLEAMSQVATNMPIEVFFGVTGAVGGATAMGAARGLNKAGKISNNLLDQADKTIAQTKQIINKIKGDHAQIDTPRVKDQKSLASQKLAQTGQDIQGGQSGIGKNTPDLPENSPPPSTTNVGRQSARRDELKATLSKSLANLSPEQRDVAIEKMLADESSPLRQQARKEVSRGPFESLKSFTSGLFSGDDDQVDGFSFVRPEQQGPATHLVRRSAEREANPGYRYKGIRGISTDPETNRTDVYFRASPKASGGTGTQMRSYYSEDPAVGRRLEYDALDTTQRIGDDSSEYMMSEKDLQAKSFARAFNKQIREGALLKAVDDEGNTLRSVDSWWER